MDRPFPCSCVQNHVASLLYLASEVRGADLGPNRVVQLAAKSYTLSDIWAACQKVAAAAGIAADTLGKVTQGALPKEATVTELNVCPAVDCAKAEALGMPMEVDIETIIADYVARHVKTEEGEPRVPHRHTPFAAGRGRRGAGRAPRGARRAGPRPRRQVPKRAAV